MKGTQASTSDHIALFGNSQVNEALLTDNICCTEDINCDIKQLIINNEIKPQIQKKHNEDTQALSYNEFMTVLEDLDALLEETLKSDAQIKHTEVMDLIDISPSTDNEDCSILNSPSTSYSLNINCCSQPMSSTSTEPLIKKTVSGTIEESFNHNERRTSLTNLEPLSLPVILFLHQQVNSPSEPESYIHSDQPSVVGRHNLLLSSNERFTPRDVDVSQGEPVVIEPEVRSMPVISFPTEQDSFPEGPDKSDKWLHLSLSILALLSCTFGLYNVSQFAMYTIYFGVNFMIQFVILSLVIGIPMFTFSISLGIKLKSSLIQMWRISPIFQGVSISLILWLMLTAVYTIVELSWLMVYLKDNILTRDQKVWTNNVIGENTSLCRWENITNYFNNRVLERLETRSGLGNMKWQLILNLCIIWCVIMLGLLRGFRSYEKLINILVIGSICCFISFIVKLLLVTPLNIYQNIVDVHWDQFFNNANCWLAAAQQVFLTWILLSVCTIQLSSHNIKKTNSLCTQTILVIIFTFVLLGSVSFVALVCNQLINIHGCIYIPGSFEMPKFLKFLYERNESLPPATLPLRSLTHYAGVMGIRSERHGADSPTYSGWYPIVFVTQFMPALFMLSDSFSSIWISVFYITFIFFGLSQHLTIWYTIYKAIVSMTEAKCSHLIAAVCVCVCGILFSLPFTADDGIQLSLWFEQTLSGWCVLGVWIVCIIGATIVRGGKYSGYNLAKPLMSSVAGFVGFYWTVALPVLLLVLAILDYRVGRQRDLYVWRKVYKYSYWPIWCKQDSVITQQLILLMVPAVAVIQVCRYLNEGPNDILERVRAVYRPRSDLDGTFSVVHTSPQVTPDPPPRYTPPPSYSTATGLKRLFRESIKRVKRLATSELRSHENPTITISGNVECNLQNLTTSNQQTTECRGSEASLNDINTSIQWESPIKITRNAFRRSLGSVRRNRKAVMRTLSLSREHLLRGSKSH